jgi:D-alanine-D-alanine ligase
VGSDVRASAIAADKAATKMFFASAGMDLAKDRVLSSDLPRTQWARVFEELRVELGQAFLVKPVHGGSTLGMSRIGGTSTPRDFEQALEQAFHHDDSVLVEEFIDGAELTCGVLDLLGDTRALPPTLIQSQATEWYDFQSKYAPGGSTHQCPAPLDSELTSRVQVAALQAHRAVGARDLSRSDFLLTGAGRLVVLEVNTLPGMTSVSNYPEAASVAGLSFSELADRLVQNASQRGVAQAPVAPALPGT